MHETTQALLNSTVIKAKSKLAVEKLIDEMKRVLSQQWNQQTRKAIIEALNEIQRLEGAITRSEFDRISEKLSVRLGVPFADLVSDRVVEVEEAAYMQGARAGMKGSGLSFAWTFADMKALDTVANDTMFWIGDHYSDDVQKKIDNILNDFFKGQSSRKEVYWQLKEELGIIFNKSDAYWNLLADHMITKTKEIGRVTGYEQAGAEVVRVKAILDDRTTEICRRLHGQVISVKDLRKQVDNYFKAAKKHDKEAIKKFWPMYSDKDAKKKLSSQQKVNSQIKAGKLGLPPYHFGCRTITVVEFMARPGTRVLDDKEKQFLESD